MFQVHSDGSVTFVVGTDRGSVGSIDSVRVTPARWEHGALPLSALVPCATYTVAEQRGRAIPARDARRRRSRSARRAPRPRGPTVLVTFVSGPSDAGDRRPARRSATLRGTVAFSLPSGTTSCSVASLVSLQSTPLAR
jgi:hypothetical protein